MLGDSCLSWVSSDEDCKTEFVPKNFRKNGEKRTGNGKLK
jgi:hypothetical protein